MTKSKPRSKIVMPKTHPAFSRPLHFRFKQLKEIRFYQRTTHKLIQQAPFVRVVQEITKELRPDLRWKKEAMRDLQEVAEAELHKIFQMSDNNRQHRKRETLLRSDMRLACKNVKIFDEGSYLNDRRLR